MNLIQRILYNVPRHIKDVWWNQSCWMKDKKYPIVFDENKRYIECEIGLEVVMGELKSGKKIYYKVVKIWRTRGSDFYYPSDAINCNLKFSRIGK